MRFLVDAQRPRRLAVSLAKAGHDLLHTLELPNGNRTTDRDIIEQANRDSRAVITKDADLVTSFITAGQPQRLLLVSTGNISNADLEALLLPSLDRIVNAFAAHSFLELTKIALTVHA